MFTITIEAIFSKEIRGSRVHSFPYLGHLALGLLDKLTEESGVPSIRMFTPAGACAEYNRALDEAWDRGDMKETLETATWPDRWFSPKEAWKMADGLCYHLLWGGKSSPGLDRIKTIRSEVILDAMRLRRLLEKASENDILFKFEVAESDDPPPALLEWIKIDMEELADALSEVLEGCEQMEETHE